MNAAMSENDIAAFFSTNQPDDKRQESLQWASVSLF